MAPIIWLFDTVVSIVIFVVVVQAIVSWLLAFNIINRQNMMVYQFCDALDRLTEPIYRPIRRVLPDLGGVDITPMVIIVGLLFLQQVIHAF